MTGPGLEDPEWARWGWRRFRRVLVWMTGASALAAAAGVLVLEVTVGPLPLLARLFTAGGIFLTVLLAAALFGLMFLSSGSGHDDLIEDPSRPEEYE